MKQLLTSCFLLTALTAAAQPYCQQRVDTKIAVRLDDIGHFIHAREEMVYTNNSPDTLRSVFIHLWPNAYSSDQTPFAQQLDRNGNTKFYYSAQSDRGYIDSLDFTIDGASAEHYIAENAPDIARIDLPHPLLPGGHINIATPFRVKIPIVFSRMGHTGQAYYLSQWFPKPAVYDRLGWHTISYLDQGEFLSEYGSYDVHITLPQNYVVMATGNCMDDHENAWLDSLAAIKLPDSVLTDAYPASATTTKTLHYHEDNVHDFAWFADKRWLVRKDTVTSPGTDHVVTAWAAFLPGSKLRWKRATEYLRDAVTHYGKWVGPYPYNTIKAVQGDMKAGGGMEYPTVTIIDRTATGSLATVVVHEAGHNWFYGMLGSNERDHAWMDEGINTFYEQKTLAAVAQTDTTHRHVAKPRGSAESLFYYEQVATHTDQPIDQPAAAFVKQNYGIDVYYKTALMLNWLEAYMGADNFARGMHDYYDTWHYRHPYPADFRACMQKYTGKPLGWFFDGVLTTSQRIDFAVTDVTGQDGKLMVTVQNHSGISLPVQVDVYNEDSVIGTAWTAPFLHDTVLTIPATQWTKVRVNDLTPDAKVSNGVYKSYGLTHHSGLRIRPFFGLNRNDQESMFLSLATGYNQYDGRMLGIMVHNLTLPENRFRYAIAPLYGFGSEQLVGAGSVGMLWYPGNALKEIMLQADGKTFHNDEATGLRSSTLYARYVKLAPSLTFTFNEHNALSPVTRMLQLKGYLINEQSITGSELYPSMAPYVQNYYGRLRYTHNNARTYNPFSYSGEAQAGADFAKINLEGNARVDYNTRGKALYVRGYLGKFFAISNDPAVTSRYELNSSYSGIDDYLYDGTYMGRNAQSRLAAQQISMQEGGFKIPVFNNVARSDNWMATINLKTDLPTKYLKLFRLFFDAGLIPNVNPSAASTSSTTLLYEGGIEVPLIKNAISVYLPVIMSSDYQNYLQNTFGKKNMFARSVSFTFDLQNINWLKTPQKGLKLVSN